MIRDTFFFKDVHSDLFITHGGLLSKKTVYEFLGSTDFGKIHSTWKCIKKYILEAVNTHDEVRERQPVLCDMFKELKLGKDIRPLQKEGDLLLRDFIVEVKQPSNLKLSSIESFTTESNDQQLLRAIRNRNRQWGILTNASEWQFVFDFEGVTEELAIPFISFSVLDMINDEDSAKQQICLFVLLLTNREVRKYLIRQSLKETTIATSSFSENLKKIVENAVALGIKNDNINKLIELCFRITFIFYAEDIGALPRLDRRYQKFDLRRYFAQSGRFDPPIIRKILQAFSKQEWSKEKIKQSGNEEFWSKELDSFITQHSIILNSVALSNLWFDFNGTEIDLSEMSSSDLCDVYQHCVYYDKNNVGTVYTNARLSNFINHWITENMSRKLEPGDIILDPACGSGHLLKRLLFLSKKMVKSSSFKNRSEMLKYFCENHLMGIDINPTAVFITKLNLWLTCIQSEASLPSLPRIEQDNTLKRFEESFSGDDLQMAKFLKEKGTRVVAIISNPPWDMVESNNPEFELLKSNFWTSHKKKISCGKNNLALNFLYIIDEILDKNGIATVIMPGVFFVGSDSKVRDHLIEKISSYLPVRTNRDFGTVDKSQNYGIIGFKKTTCPGPISVYFSEENGTNKIITITKDVFFSPRLRKETLHTLGTKFSTDSLLPLFSSEKDLQDFRKLLKETMAVDLWTKGKEGKKIQGENLSSLAGKFAIPKKGLHIATRENAGNSPMPLNPIILDENSYDNCSHKVMKMNLSEIDAQTSEKLISFLNSTSVNNIVNMLRTSKSIQSATLNFLGLPTEIAKLSFQKAVLSQGDKITSKIASKKKARSRTQAS
ncbi:MAG: N-6 DNA methylase [Bdellovibrio sp.]